MKTSDLLTRHTLIAGASGSGKSVFLHHLLDSIEGNGLVLIDFKSVELREYRRRCSWYADTPKKVMNALDCVTHCMEKRKKKMIRKGVKDWCDLGYNRTYVVIDEFMDGVALIGKPFQDALIRISCQGRAFGIVLLICTQRPTKRYLETIAVNCDNRVAMRCQSATDSRLIIGEKGAEDLPLYGQALIKMPSQKELIKVDIPPRVKR